MNYEDVIKFENLLKAGHKVCNGVRWKDSVVGYEHNIMRNTEELCEELENGTYKLQPYQIFEIFEPKYRVIVATRIRDRQVQRSLCDNGFYDEMTKSFIYDNCACLKGKGIDFALNRMTAHMRRYYSEHGYGGYVLKCDIHHYFQSIRHDVAKRAVAKRIKDERVLKLVYDIIDSFGDIGIGLGSQISQLIALAVLDELDHFIKEQLHIKHYIRYMDDFILIHNDKEYLKYCKEQIEIKLKEIGLSLNDKTKISKLNEGVIFLQWKFILTETGRIIRKMPKKKLSRQRRKLKRIYKKEMEGIYYEGCMWTSLDAWCVNAKRGDTYFQRKRIKQYARNLEKNYARKNK